MVGCSNKEIAHRLGVSVQTAKWHVGNLCVMFKTPNRAGLAAAAVQLLNEHAAGSSVHQSVD